jgi:hypothetical protein
MVWTMSANGGLAHVLPMGPAVGENKMNVCSSMIFNDFGAILQNQITVKNKSLMNQVQ